jgi:hypothetical protein
MKARLSIVIAAMVVLSMLLASCGPTPTPVVTEPPVTEEVVTYPPAPEFIEIGASIPLTGKFGSLGSQVKVGYDYAIADINAAGGVFVEEYGTKIPLPPMMMNQIRQKRSAIWRPCSPSRT